MYETLIGMVKWNQNKHKNTELRRRFQKGLIAFVAVMLLRNTVIQYLLANQQMEITRSLCTKDKSATPVQICQSTAGPHCVIQREEENTP